jgi:phage shock protein PspC (stress-responsive transcriptional regulator)
MNNHRGLYRSQLETIIGGVCGGIAKSLNVDPVLIRIVFILLAIFGGSGLLIYAILWIVLPVDPDEQVIPETQKQHTMESENPKTSGPGSGPGQKPPVNQKPKNDGNLIAGLILITLGAIFLLERWIYWLDFKDFWPLILVVAGIVLIRRSFMKP